MQKKTIQRICIALATLLVLSSLIPIISVFVSADDLNSQLSNAQKQLAQLASEKKKIETELKNIEANKSKTYAKIENYDKQIENISSQIKKTEEILDTLDKDIDAQTKNLEVATLEMDEQYDALKTRIRVSYENGQSTYLDILLGSSDLYDMLSKIEITSQIMDYDNKLFSDYAKNVEIVTKAKETLETNQKMQEEYKNSLTEKKASLSAASKNAESALKDLYADETAATEQKAALQKAEEEASKKVAEIARQLANQSSDYVGGEFSWPLKGYTTISSVFGPRIHPVTGKNTVHTGIDLPAPKGTTISSANAGKVIVSDYHSAYGNYVMVDHGGGRVTLYGHMSKRSVSAGQTVTSGQKLGEVGTTGLSTGNHLHFEIIINGVHKNPMNYFS